MVIFIIDIHFDPQIQDGRHPPYWFLMPMWPFKWHAPMPYWNIFDRLFLLSDVMIWPNFALGIQDGRHPPFWISWIFTFSSYMRVIHQMRLISCYKVISYITLITTNYDKIVIWPFNSRWPPYWILLFICLVKIHVCNISNKSDVILWTYSHSIFVITGYSEAQLWTWNPRWLPYNKLIFGVY